MRTEIMKNMIKRTTALLLLVALLVTFLPFRADAAVSTDTALMKLTDSYNPGTGSFTLSAQSRIFVVSEAATGVPADWKQTAELISSEFNTQFSGKNLPLPLVYGSAVRVRSGDIILKVDGTSKLAAEGYELKITADNCTVTAKDVDGLLYGAFMLLRHFSVYGGTTIPACTVKDEPDTKERTLMLDCARKYWSVDWIKNLIRQMAWMGYNTLELHMTEDQGIRMNIWQDKSGNTVKDSNGNDFGWICGYNVASWAIIGNEKTGESDSYADPNGHKFYNRDEITEIVQLAQKYHIEIIPGVDVPGHCDHLITQYKNQSSVPTFTYNGITYNTNPKGTIAASGSTKTIDISNDYARNLTLAIIQSYAEFFGELGCNKINIGCDEVVVSDSNWKTWANNNNGLGITNCSQYDAFVIYTNLVCDMLQGMKYNYTVRAFNDYIYDTKKSWPAGDTEEKATAPLAFDPDLEMCWWEKARDTEKTDYENGRAVYNCLNNYCYYVLRCNYSYNKNTGELVAGQGDARSPDNYNWGFHHSTEQRIYEEWNPSRLYEYNAGSSSNIAAKNLKGAYFLIWGDWAGWNTEVHVWNGLTNTDNASDMFDTGPKSIAAGNEGGTYNLIDRMWSNSVKMWNWDIDSSLTYDSYWPLRNKYRLYPGFTEPSKGPSMESASEMNQAPDFPALQAALGRKPALPPSEYSAGSYSAWLGAWNSAKSVYDDHLSSYESVQSAVTALNTAFDGLETPAATITLLTTVNGAETTIETIEVTSGTVARVICTPAGYRFSYVEGNVTACKLFSGASAIILTGTVTPATPAKVYYQNTPDLSLLKRLLDGANAAASSSSAYQTAVTNAQKFYNSISADPAASVTQAEVDEQVKALIAARTKASFATDDVTTSILSVRSTSNYVAKGKSAVLVVTTTADVTELKITDSQSNNVELAECVAQASTMANGDVVKVWYLRFPMDTIGTFSYTLTATGNNNTTVSAEVTLTCK